MAKRIDLKDLENKSLEMLPIRRGCEAKKCACLGTCEEIVGYVPREEYEKFVNMLPTNQQFLNRYVDPFLSR